MKIPSKTWKILCITLTITNIAVFTFMRQPVAEHVLNDYMDKYPYLDSHRGFHEREDLVVNIQELREYLKALPEQNKDWAEMSIYFEVMDTGANVTVNQDLKLWPASLAKLPVGMIAMKKIEKGNWDLNKTMLELVAEDADPTTPDVQSQIGKSFSIGFLLERLLLESDNTAYHMLVRNLTEEELLSIANAVGIEEFFTADGKISAKDYTRLLRALYNATYLDEDNSQYLLKLLGEGKFEKLLRAGVPREVFVAHKWGINDKQNVYGDSGIIYLDHRPYMVSVIIHGLTEDQPADQAKAEKLIKEVSEKAYSFMSRK